MALILKTLYKGYFWLFDELADKRVDGFFLMSSPFQPLICAVIYLYFIFDIGPKFMKNRPPYNLDKILIVFNLAQVLVNCYIVYMGTKELMQINWDCALIDYSVTPQNMFILRTVHLYFLTKLADLLDTVFFVLRKKDKQISFLHVYHHFGMIGLGWVGVKFLGGGHSMFVGILNSFVHAVMYFYYLLTIWDTKYKQSIWWKKHITQIQMIQFFIFLVIYGRLLFKPDCAYPKLASYFFVPQNLFMLFLFGDFYWKTYIKSKSNTQIHEKQDE